MDVAPTPARFLAYGGLQDGPPERPVWGIIVCTARYSPRPRLRRGPMFVSFIRITPADSYLSRHTTSRRPPPTSSLGVSYFSRLTLRPRLCWPVSICSRRCIPQLQTASRVDACFFQSPPCPPRNHLASALAHVLFTFFPTARSDNQYHLRGLGFASSPAVVRIPAPCIGRSLRKMWTTSACVPPNLCTHVAQVHYARVSLSLCASVPPAPRLLL